MGMTIHEIAEKAGVSIATVSRAVNPHTRDKVAPETREKIDKLVGKYSYTPNRAARNLRQASTRTIGVVVPFYRDIFYSAYYMHLLSGVTNTLEGTGYQFKLLTLGRDQQNWDRYDFRSGEQVDGLIVALWFRLFSGKEVLEKIAVPTVVIDEYEKDVRTMFICGDHLEGGRIAAEHLYSRGHRRMAVITGPDWSRDCRLRVQGFKACLKGKGIGLDPDLIVPADYLEDKAKTALDQILEKAPRTTAVFCCTDIMAGGVLARLKELGLSCPQDISVVGYDDDFMIVNRFPQLTSVSVPVYESAKQAVEYILEQLKDKPKKRTAAGARFLPVKLVERASVSEL